jgi:two-component system sensor kinase FixL
MASSPEFIRLATGSLRALADTALDSLREAVVIVDARHKHFPLVLANAAARRSLIEDSEAFGLIESPLFHWMAPESAASVESSLTHPSEHRSPVRRVLQWRCAMGEMSIMTDIKPLVATSGQRLIMLTFAPAIPEPDFDQGPESPWGLAGVIRNITARRDSDARLRQSEVLLRATTANTADLLVLVDMDLRVRFINKSVGGMGIETIIGREVDVLLPESARAGVLDKLRYILNTGETATYEFESIEAGAVRHFENRAVLVRDASLGTGISISTRDITERKRLEQEILEVSGRERQSIGRDLHDGLGQELTGVALLLRSLATQVQGRCPEAIESVNEIVALVNRSIENARSLARGLLPVRTETGGLAFALRDLASRSRDLYGLDVNFTAEVAQELNLDETDASHLYRIAQEALTNASRHGHATLVHIHLEATGVRFLLCIKDNGEGFHPPMSHYSGMGLKIMRYRAGIVGAKFEISPIEPRGTVVRVMGEQPQTAAGLKPAWVT